MAACLCFLCLCLCGCAAGRGPNGQVVVGWDVASLPETAEESIGAIANLLIPGSGVALAGITGAVGLAIRNGSKRREAEREAARLAGANDGWDEREKAAAVQHPLAASPAPAGDGAAGGAD